MLSCLPHLFAILVVQSLRPQPTVAAQTATAVGQSARSAATIAPVMADQPQPATRRQPHQSSANSRHSQRLAALGFDAGSGWAGYRRCLLRHACQRRRPALSLPTLPDVRHHLSGYLYRSHAPLAGWLNRLRSHRRVRQPTHQSIATCRGGRCWAPLPVG